jgi:hypothetical protein
MLVYSLSFSFGALDLVVPCRRFPDVGLKVWSFQAQSFFISVCLLKVWSYVWHPIYPLCCSSLVALSIIIWTRHPGRPDSYSSTKEFIFETVFVFLFLESIALVDRINHFQRLNTQRPNLSIHPSLQRTFMPFMIFSDTLHMIPGCYSHHWLGPGFLFETFVWNSLARNLIEITRSVS